MQSEPSVPCAVYGSSIIPSSPGKIAIADLVSIYALCGLVTLFPFKQWAVLYFLILKRSEPTRSSIHVILLPAGLQLTFASDLITQYLMWAEHSEFVESRNVCVDLYGERHSDVIFSERFERYRCLFLITYIDLGTLTL